MALFVQGHDPNTLDDGELDDARDYLIDLKKKVKSITSDYQDPLKSGELILTQAYSGDVFQAQDTNPKVEYVIPKSGAFQWVDAMMIPEGAKHPRNAHEFMNYMLEPKVGAALTNFVNYGSPNKAAEPYIDKSILDDPLIYPPADVLDKIAVPEGPRRGRDQVRRPVDRGQDVLSETRRPPATLAGGVCPTGSKGNILLLPTTLWLVVLLLVPMFVIVGYSLGKRGIVNRSASTGATSSGRTTRRRSTRGSSRSSSARSCTRARPRCSASCSGSRSRTGSRASAGASATCTSCS